jgi:NodT family efflux transporter outer membrane factor (OMF) lipoprotein
MLISAFKISPVLALLLFTGCALGPNFQSPGQKQYAATLTSAPEPGASTQLTEGALQPAWWNLFGDATLTMLERDALLSNLDLQTAYTRLTQSRASLKVTGAALLPTVSANASQLRERASPNGILALTGTAASIAPTAANGSDPFGTASLPGDSGSAPYSVSQFGIDASWEVDLWGRTRRLREAATAQVSAAFYDTQAMRVSIAAEVARVYLELRGTQSDLRIARSGIELTEKSLHVARRRAALGVATDFDTAIAAAQLATFRAAVPNLVQRQRSLMNALAMLLARPPRALDEQLTAVTDVPRLPANVPVGLPSQLARRRPDILRAEAQLHAATAAIGVAKADFYPSISLTGSLGFQALKFSEVGNWSSRQFAVGPVLHLPIFEGGRLAGNLAMTESRQQEAALDYQRMVLGAWHEVDNALTAFHSEQERDGFLEEAVAENRRALARAERRYAQGATDYLNILVTQQRLLDSENLASRSRTNMALNMVTLYKTLGGGWNASATVGQ